jgi:hypothetical protein
MGVLALMTAASTVAFAGPALTRAAAQAGLRSELAGATPGSTDVVVRMDDERGLDDQAAVDVRTAGSAAVGSLFGAPVVVWRSQSVLRWSTSSTDSQGELPSRLRAASTGCRGYVLLSGHCPEQAGEVLVPRLG